MTNVTLYSDGAYSSRTKTGGYAYLLISGKTQKLNYGKIPEPTTNQRAELGNRRRRIRRTAAL